MTNPIRVEPFRLSGSLGAAVKPVDNPVSRASRDGVSPPFMDILKESVMKVNNVQIESDKLVQRLALGEVDDVSEVSIAVEKAELALRLMVQIRDKLVDAYQQVARMSV